MFKPIATEIPGCYEILPGVADDARGRFVKVFHRAAFGELHLETEFAEEYYSVSRKRVVRGFHFQSPPADHVKMVYCVYGWVMDAVVDLRVGSPTFQKTAVFDLSATKGNLVYIPKGLAHGFCTLSDEAILVYKVSTVYSPENDSGILWNSAGVNWPVDQPVISDRDRGFPGLAEFRSPFSYE
jgi:dTDP-4-dehydrorhamnose 3,5-epimerase